MPTQDGKFLKNQSITQAKLNLVDAVGAKDAVTLDQLNALQISLTNTINAINQNRDWKDSVRAASTANVNIASPGATLDGVTLVSGDRIVLKNQTAGAQNGIYVWTGAAVALTRATDADTSAKVTSNLHVPVDEGTVNAGTAWKVSTTGTITVGTTSITFVPAFLSTAPVPSNLNKFMTASVTTTDGDAACATALAATPAQGSFVAVMISNGFWPTIGNGVKTGCDCYWSRDGGATALSFNQLQVGDSLRWNGSIATVQLSASDTVSFFFNV